MRKRVFDKAKMKALRTAVLFLLPIAFCIYFFSPQSIRGEEVIGIYPSPNNTYVLTTYLNSGNMTTGFSVLGRVRNTKTNLSKNIYWKYHCNVSYVRWLDDTTVVINDVVIRVRKDVYTNSDYDSRYLEFPMGEQQPDASEQLRPDGMG